MEKSWPIVIGNPYLIDIPFVFHFSGGRTSGYLLHHVLDAYGSIPPCGVEGFEHKPCPVVFTNTGKEFPQTLDFVRECGERWGVEIHWVEWTNKKMDGKGYRIVTYETASRNGEPFQGLIDSKNYLPNVVQRLCTQHLKILACDRFLRDYWGLPDYTGVTGIRADEPKRFKSGGQDSRNPHRYTTHPLRWAGVTQADVLTWWDRQPFNLALQPHESNCDLCFLKSNQKRIQVMIDHPETAQWWMDRELENTNRPGREKPRTENYRSGFRDANRKNYEQLYHIAMAKSLGGDLSGDGDTNEFDEDLIDCNCTD